MTRGFKSLLASVIVLVLVFAAGSVTIHSSTFHRYLLSILRKATGWGITLNDSQISIARGRLILTGVDARDPKGKIHFSSSRVLLDLSALSLIRGKFIVTDLEIDQPFVEIQTTGEKKELIPDIIQRIFQKFERSWVLQNTFLEDVAIRQLRLSLRPPANAEDQEIREGSIEEAHLEIGPTLLRRIEIDAQIGEMSGFLPHLASTEISLSLKSNGIRLKKLHLKAPKVELTLKGNWLGDLRKGSLDLAGTLVVPTVLSDELTFELEADLKDDRAEIKTLTAQLEKGIFEGKGTFDLIKKHYDIPFTAKDVSLESIFQKFPSPVLGPARGTASVEGRIRGDLPALSAEAKAEIQEFHHGAMHAHAAAGNLRFHWPDLDFEADIRPDAGGRTQGTVRGGVLFKILHGAEYGGKRKGTLKTLDLSLQGASLQALLPTLNVSGTLDGNLHLKGVDGTTSVDGSGHGKVTGGHWFLGGVNLLETDIAFHPGGKIIFTKTEIRLPEFSPLLWPAPLNLDTSGDSVLFSGEPTAGFTVKGRYEKESGYFKIESFGIRRGGNDLRGEIGLRTGGATDGRLTGTGNLEWLSFFPAYFREGRGPARFDLTLSGTTRDPLLRGRIEFEGNDISLRGYSEITDLQGTLTLEGNAVRPHLTGFLGEGKFLLGGRLGMDHFRPEDFDLSLQGTNLTFARPNSYRVDFDADVTLKGRRPSPRLSGRIDVVDGRYSKPFAVRELVLKPFDEGTAEPDSWGDRLKDLGLDLQIKNSGDLRIRNNVADLFLRADLQVQGSYGRPRIGGALVVTEGTVHFLGEDFVLNEGRLEYIDPAKREPYLTLVAQEEVPPQYTVFIEVKGFLSNLEVNLTSSPGLPREDIISLLASGLTQDELRESGQSRRSMGMSVLGGEISGLVERPIARSTGLDVFRLEASESGALSKMSFGKNLTDRLTLEFVTDFAPETAQRTIQANYYLTDNILLKGFRTWEAGADPRFNFNISFRFRLY